MAASSLTAFGAGLALAFTLIVAIGAQNAFVLRQGVLRQHVGAVVLFCLLADAALMSAGVFGAAWLQQAAPLLAPVMTLAGAVFLLVYGARALQRAARASSLRTQAGNGLTLRAALAQCAAFTFLNPHVYLDTVVLVGSVGAGYAAAVRGWFVLGACIASATWFVALGYGARLLTSWFASPRAWRWLDTAIGLTMWLLAAGLLASLFYPGAR
jgi:L-lysine exporter family protein LysE/ArgO